MKFGAFLAVTDLNEGKSQKELFDDLINLAVAAEELGYDYVWLPEHELHRFIINSASLQEAVAIAARTKRIRIGTAIFITPLFHPLTLAADIAEADILTDGRYEAGIGRGASPNALKQLQALMPPEESKLRFEEFYKLLDMALSPHETLSFSGKHFVCEDVSVYPKPLTAPRPRIWVASSSPDSAKEYAGWGADVFYPGQRRPFSDVENALKAFRSGARSDSQQFIFSRPTYVADTMEEAKKILPLIDYHEKVVGAKKIGAEVIRGGVRGWKKDAALGLSEETYLENTVIGDPDTVIEKVARYADLGIDQFVTYMTLGQDVRLALRSMQLFSERVMPRFTAWPDLRLAQQSVFE